MAKLQRKHWFELKAMAVRALKLTSLVDPRNGHIDTAEWDRHVEANPVLFTLEFCKNESSDVDYRQLALKDVTVQNGYQPEAIDQENMRRHHEDLRAFRWSFSTLCLVAGVDEDGTTIPASTTRLECCGVDLEMLTKIGSMEEDTLQEAVTKFNRSVKTGKVREVFVANK